MERLKSIMHSMNLNLGDNEEQGSLARTVHGVAKSRT